VAVEEHNKCVDHQGAFDTRGGAEPQRESKFGFNPSGLAAGKPLLGQDGQGRYEVVRSSGPWDWPPEL
jgi:hypothetical protein